MNVFPATITTNTPQQTADDVGQLFSTTLNSLVADATAIRQISSLVKVSGIRNMGIDSKNATEDVLNDPSIRQLIEIDRLVTGIEQKVTALRTILAEEKAALRKFDTVLQQEADVQARLVQQMSEAMEQLGILEEHSRSNNSNTNTNTNTTAARSNRAQAIRKDALGRQSFKSRRDSVDPRSSKENQMPSSEGEVVHHHLERISPSELRQMSRNTLGRISLPDLNEALEEIERVCDNRQKVMVPHQSKKKNNVSSNSLQRRFEYLKQQRASVDLEVEAHAGHVWVSEQELRQNCAFFRHGESTARATLSILCSLKRLKQVPGRNSEITYICLVSNNTDDEEEFI